ncbi:MAG: zf-TFIIB domain-containing protein [Verrucomicrobiae bacterium]|nr:zf-TFIIB domain-containing protein [Verrucomicrobiae bacterium]
MMPVCPKCDVALLLARLRDVEVDVCHRCRGLWLDAGELESLMRATGATPDDPLLRFLEQAGRAPRDRKYLCPRCDRRLSEISIEQEGRSLVLERCPAGHGLWFDAGELERLLAMFPPASGAGRTVDFLHELFGSPTKT